MSNTLDDVTKQNIINSYVEANPTPDNSMDIVRDIAEEYEKTPNGVRMILVGAGVYVKKAATAASSSKADAGDKPKRVSKEDAINGLVSALEAKGKPVDMEIIGKLTGKAAMYFRSVV